MHLADWVRELDAIIALSRCPEAGDITGAVEPTISIVSSVRPECDCSDGAM